MRHTLAATLTAVLAPLALAQLTAAPTGDPTASDLLSAALSSLPACSSNCLLAAEGQTAVPATTADAITYCTKLQMDSVMIVSCLKACPASDNAEMIAQQVTLVCVSLPVPDGLAPGISTLPAGTIVGGLTVGGSTVLVPGAPNTAAAGPAATTSAAGITATVTTTGAPQQGSMSTTKSGAVGPMSGAAGWFLGALLGLAII
ncbi:hypothetical protein HK101_000281 [Irineochytrium annulatum]|nr:hypothetical protein HK101_000281 [Irineochytrium annulatum]